MKKKLGQFLILAERLTEIEIEKSRVTMSLLIKTGSQINRSRKKTDVTFYKVGESNEQFETGKNNTSQPSQPTFFVSDQACFFFRNLVPLRWLPF